MILTTELSASVGIKPVWHSETLRAHRCCHAPRRHSPHRRCLAVAVAVAIAIAVAAAVAVAVAVAVVVAVVVAAPVSVISTITAVAIESGRQQ